MAEVSTPGFFRYTALHTPPASAGYHVAGVSATGPVGQATAIRSMAEYTRAFGPRTDEAAALHDDLALFFAEGGAEAFVTRVTDPTPLNTVAALAAAAASTPTGLVGLAVATPGLAAEEVGEALIAHAAATHRVALLAPARDTTRVGVQAVAGSLSLVAGAENAALLYPWVSTTSRTGTTRVVAPTGYAAAARARAHRLGYWWHPAGVRSAARTLTGQSTYVDREDGWELADHLVSAVAATPTGYQLWGWWSLGSDRANFPHLTTADLLHNVAAGLSVEFSMISAAKWSTVEQTYAQIRAAAATVLHRLAAAGGVLAAADGSDPGWRVSTRLNTERTAVEVAVDVRPLQYARLVGVHLYRIPLHVPIPGSHL